MAQAPWEAAGALTDQARRALYDYVRRQDHPVTREEAADARSISRNLAAFHLDKLVAAGLLRCRYEAPAGRPRRRGRTPKVYEPAAVEFALTVPERRYQLVGRILADAVADDPADARAAAARHAGRHGEAVGRQLAARLTVRGHGLALAQAALADLGFEPERDRPDRVVLGNCPFHTLALAQPELVCALNEAFVAGLLAGLGAGTLDARLAPRPGACCVEVTAAG